ncbi:WxL protein peptidoglycan domain-containing protein [Ornithinicoccus hortensis]|uniref:Uncharacterized protein DUF916 n=1 Tax=Ornithinicoccus hortensis TaxID=82346 RepID=A0A542YUG2_9MICO|nr:DUF916 domain-containing protein [Ornithinicoccus hortensis]TQL51726.1 uncharacterized protein DUF916 [Ornithinicoccus hortensis]
MTKPPSVLATLLSTLLTGLLTALLALGGTGAAWAAGEADAPTGDELTWSVRPADNEHGTDRANYGYLLDPGAEITDAFVVTNASPQELTLAVYAADGYTTPSGHLDLQPADTPATDLGAWVTPDTDQLVLAPGESESVEFTLAVPEDAAPGDHPGGIVTSYVTGDETGTVRLDRRLGSRIHVRVSGEQQVALAVSDLTVDQPFGANPIEPVTTTVRYTPTNTGNVRALGHETVTVSGPGGLAGTSAEVVVDEIMPGSSVTREVALEGTWPLLRGLGRGRRGAGGGSRPAGPAGAGVGRCLGGPVGRPRGRPRPPGPERVARGPPGGEEAGPEGRGPGREIRQRHGLDSARHRRIVRFG